MSLRTANRSVSSVARSLFPAARALSIRACSRAIEPGVSELASSRAWTFSTRAICLLTRPQAVVHCLPRSSWGRVVLAEADEVPAIDPTDSTAAARVAPTVVNRDMVVLPQRRPAGARREHCRAGMSERIGECKGNVRAHAVPAAGNAKTGAGSSWCRRRDPPGGCDHTASSAPAAAPGDPSRSRGNGRRGTRGQREGEADTALGSRGGLGPATHPPGQLPHQGQTDTGTDLAGTAVPLGQDPALERDRQILRAQARAAVPDLHPDAPVRR